MTHSWVSSIKLQKCVVYKCPNSLPSSSIFYLLDQLLPLILTPTLHSIFNWPLAADKPHEPRHAGGGVWIKRVQKIYHGPFMGIVNQANITNIMQIVPELFMRASFVGGGCLRGVSWKLKLPVCHICQFFFAALVVITNTKLPQVGELVLTRIISQFRKSFNRNNKVHVFFCDKGFSLYLHFFFIIRSSAIPQLPSSPI